MLVFINHNTTEDAFVTRLANELRDYRVATWVDHDDIAPDEDWGQALLDALNRCEMMIVVLSPAAVTSIPVRDQWLHHLAQDKPLVIVIARPCVVPPELEGYTTVDFTETAEQNLLHVLRALGVNMPTQPLSPAVLYRHLDETGLSLDEPGDNSVS